ncbi:MAG: thiamine pyrophosphate-binding protein [Chloroflexi bacterium]|nr:thiamine pyrophosphate-binding protein [Chloroflexota bacterium]
MKRYQCLQVLAPLITQELVIVSLGGTGLEWHAIKPRDANLYLIAMGCNTSVGLGLALALPHRRVVVLETDGSLLLNLGALATVAVQRPPNLAIFVFDNEGYERVGGLPGVTGRGVDLAAIAQGAGIANSRTVTNREDFAVAAREAMSKRELSVTVTKVEMGIEPVPGRASDGLEDKYRFVRHIEELEGRPILSGYRYKLD